MAHSKMTDISVSPRISQSDLKYARRHLDDKCDSLLILFRLLRSGYLTDIKIICGDRKWSAHKAILGSRSQWLKNAMGGGPEQGLIDEIRIEDQDSDLVDCILVYLYTGGMSRSFSFLEITYLPH
ncbi:uncharacterized protein E0L32_000805 [Thyridium curvatum]|uniref:BTB domain-containing protein n=1 Tax=Thyridium curvatum TaxID=1093900 RepID=A0A507B788_9PEZI|nr:uncharacterized protein E0L32_000805 [Thyridium curvatum]TPX12628.1 hypothetical protein E0L32_000805 [Thyridium curvatum]